MSGATGHAVSRGADVATSLAGAALVGAAPAAYVRGMTSRLSPLASAFSLRHALSAWALALATAVATAGAGIELPELAELVLIHA